MKTLAVGALALVLLAAPGCALLQAHRPPAEAEESARPMPADLALRDELLAMQAADQAARNAWMAAGMTDKAHAARVRALDEKHTTRLEAIIAEHGWPTEALVGPLGVEAAFILVQHADHDPAFQARMLPEIEAAAARGELEKQHVALLTDRVLRAQDKPQRYGTQFWPQNGEWQPQELEDPANVDARRKAMGLMPLSEYKAVIEQTYGKPPVDRPVPKASAKP
jgi:hypothetical protein